MSFTPGPWFHELHPSSMGRPQVISIQTREKFDDLEEDDDPTLAGIYSADPVDFANARLMAAAPELLEALELAAETLRRYEGYHRAKQTPESFDKAVANQKLAMQFEAVIAKARGEGV